MDLRVGEAEAGHDRRNPLARERRHDRDRAAGSDQCRPPADDALERVLTELDRRRIGRDEPGRRRRPALDVELGSGRRRGAQEALHGRSDRFGILAGGEPDRHVRMRDHGQDRLLQLR